MTPEQEQAFREQMTELGYPDFEIMPGEDEVLMLHVHGKLICGVFYALSLSDAHLKMLIDETVAGGQS